MNSGANPKPDLGSTTGTELIPQQRKETQKNVSEQQKKNDNPTKN